MPTNFVKALSVVLSLRLAFMCSVKWEIRYENKAIWLSGEPVSVLDVPYCPKISFFFSESKYINMNLICLYALCLLQGGAKLVTFYVPGNRFCAFLCLLG